MQLTISTVLSVVCAIAAGQNVWFCWRTMKRVLTTKDQLLSVAVLRCVLVGAYAVMAILLYQTGVFVHLVDLVTR